MTPGNCARLRHVDCFNVSVRVGRAHDTHVQLMLKRHVAGEVPAPGYKRQILESGDRHANPGCWLDRHAGAFMLTAAARTALIMFS